MNDFILYALFLGFGLLSGLTVYYLREIGPLGSVTYWRDLVLPVVIATVAVCILSLTSPDEVSSFACGQKLLCVPLLAIPVAGLLKVTLDRENVQEFLLLVYGALGGIVSVGLLTLVQWVWGGLLYVGLVVLVIAILCLLTASVTVEDTTISRGLFVGLLLAVFLFGLLVNHILGQNDPEYRARLAAFSDSFFQYYLYGAVVFIVLFQGNINYTLYRMWFAEDLSLVESRAPWKIWSFRCSHCGASLPGPLGVCPSCGIGLIDRGTHYHTPEHLPGALGLLILFAFDVFYGLVLSSAWPNVTSQSIPLHLSLGGIGLNVVVIVFAIVALLYYASQDGKLTRYY